ncbi:MAG: hypothetical protein H0U76_00700 [Ktedonobacteraceae bacterium]|nr:hypothetical protein [Ktedonobacteraceae bacterium]
MGQYRQWLHYRDIDQLLRSQLAISEHELEQLQAQVEVLEKHVFSWRNEIFQALIEPERNDTQSYQEELAIQPDKQVIEGVEGLEEELVIEDVDEEDLATISPALLAWSQLPNFDTQMLQEQESDSSDQTLDTSPPQADEQLLPTDINAFIHEHYLTNPEINVPWWLQNIVSSHNEEFQEPQPIDRQSERADQLVERWFERWGKQPTKTKRSREDQTP